MEGERRNKRKPWIDKSRIEVKRGIRKDYTRETGLVK
jgi:hypothetical protein